jgi:hypothetical protein
MKTVWILSVRDMNDFYVPVAAFTSREALMHNMERVLAPLVGDSYWKTEFPATYAVEILE